MTVIVVYRRRVRMELRALPASVSPEQRPAPMPSLGEGHFETTTCRAPQPSWLAIPSANSTRA